MFGVFVLRKRLIAAAVTSVNERAMMNGYGNSGMGFAAPVTVPVIVPDCEAGSRLSWKFTFEVTVLTVTLTPVTFWS